MPSSSFSGKTLDGRSIWQYGGTLRRSIRGTLGTADRKIAASLVSSRKPTLQQRLSMDRKKLTLRRLWLY